jgi:hypothetical protein
MDIIGYSTSKKTSGVINNVLEDSLLFLAGPNAQTKQRKMLEIKCMCVDGFFRLCEVFDLVPSWETRENSIDTVVSMPSPEPSLLTKSDILPSPLP